MIVRTHESKTIIYCYDCPFYSGGLCQHREVKEPKRRAAKANNWLCPLKEKGE